jgi:glutamate dehydrogenase
MTHAALASLCVYARDNAGDQALADFLLAYYDGADPDELQVRGPATLLAMAVVHRRLLATFLKSDRPQVQVYNPSLAEHGFVSSKTLIQIVLRDMPFLVDSVTMAVNRSSRMAHWIVHPLLVVDQNAQGELAELSLATPQDAHVKPICSLITVECDRIVLASDRLELEQELQQVLADVMAAVTDWPQMLSRLQAVRADSAKSPLSAAGQQEGLELLHWLEAEHFTFLGARDYQLQRQDNQVELVAVASSGLGILRGEPRTPVAALPTDALGFLDSDQLVLVTKAMSRSTVHRPAWLDCLTVKRFDAEGRVVGEARFLGLYTSKAYAARVDDIPQVRRSAAAVRATAGVMPESHAGKSLQAILNAYPRDELFQVDPPTLIEHTIGILRLQESQRARVFLRRDPFGRFTSVQVFVPRDRYNTELRIKVGDDLSRALDGHAMEFTPTLTDHPLARIHYLIRAREVAPRYPDVNALEARVAQIAQRWEDECKQSLLQIHGEALGLQLAQRLSGGFSAAYKEDFSGAMAAGDVLVLSTLTATLPIAVSLYCPLDSAPGQLRFKIYSLHKVALSDSLPVLERMGVRVLDERPYSASQQLPDGQSHELWIHDLGLQLPASANFADIRERFERLFVQVWRNEYDNDELNRLVLSSRLDGRAIAVLRAYTRYFKQLGFAYSPSYLADTLYKNSSVAQALYDLFEVRFLPELGGDRQAQQEQLNHSILNQLGQVASLDEDRILRQYQRAILATVRSNVWQTDAAGEHKPYMSFKFDSAELPGMPEPKPKYEIWVYSPRMEGIHLRIDKVARGGLRWSDRREDFRTEILGLVKAQQVKNTVIVPVGSKGGFVLKNPPPAGDRDAFMAEGIACYRMLLSGLLDLTDNLVKGHTVAPAQVVRHDPDDPYLVVAADKGTASFSDIANSVSAQYGFWLGDAFASGGSVGYDHKKMGITARGAWESAKRHFRALSHDIQTQPFTVMGIGDMSGDVFGNGMLLSEQIKLVAAFDHRHIFIDPNPDVARSFVERQRLFGLARSSWDDFDRSILSDGGGIYPRSAKSISLSEAARSVLGIEALELSPTELLHALLQAPVDMVYNGGIGTYVKSSQENHAQAGDKSSDAYRVNGSQLRCKAVVEGGNLGCTQLGRIEYAQNGGLIYTDAIDNSAGVDCSDHEVNIKILLDRVVEAGDLTLKQRNDLLASMTDEVGYLVLTDNYYQTQALDVACHRPLYYLAGQQRLMQWLEGAGRLHRAIEFLPTDAEISRRGKLQQGLTAPEGAVVLAYAKMSVYADLLASNLPDDPYFVRVLKAYFPKVLTERFASAIDQHPLKREIIATFVANTVVNRTGATFVNFLAAEAAASTADVVRAYTLAREIFDLEPLWDQIDVLDGQVTSALQLDLLCKLIAIAQRASRWILRARFRDSDLPTLITRYQPGARELRANLAQWLPSEALENWHKASAQLVQAGVAQDLASQLGALEYIFGALDLVDLTLARPEVSLAQAAQTYFAIDKHLGLSAWRVQINRLPTDSLWQTQARGSARDDVYAIANQLTQSVLSRAGGLAAWSELHAPAIERLCRLLATISQQGPDLAPISVAMRELRHLV